jgi:two-component system nitrogen regulation sensor histidine kinase GlnL
MHRDELQPEALARRILENQSNAVLLFTADLKLRYMNPAGEMLFAVSARRVARSHVTDLLGLESPLMGAIRRAQSQGTSVTEREQELVLPGGRATTVDSTITPIHDPQLGEALLLELQPVDRQLRILREEKLLAQHNATLAVVKGLAHEINNPLGGLRGAAQLLERELPNESLREYTRVIIGEADRLQNLLARLLGPKTVPHKRRTNVHEVLERVRTLVLAACPLGIRLVRDYDPSIPELWVDPDQVIQAVLNIVRNAVQSLGDKGTITLRTRTRRQFTIGAQRHRLVTAIEIIDDGPGVPPEILDKIFYPMVTGRPEGTGLGLSIAQTLIHQHGGLIECNSRPKHTTFTLLLPLDTKELAL